jgi:hypothetical protein
LLEDFELFRGVLKAQEPIEDLVPVKQANR